MFIDYVPNPPDFKSDEDKAVLKAVLERRGERGLIALDRALLHAPRIAGGWYVIYFVLKPTPLLGFSLI